MHAAGDTIVAVGSPPGRSLRGMVRASGPGAAGVARAWCGNDVPLVPHTLAPVRLTSPPIPALLAYSPAPRSYTGEDTVELQTPGNPALLARLLRQALDAGARLADPGEFTFRAFSNGRLDLTQAEGVAATIAAVSDAQLHAASLLRRGRLGSTASWLVDKLATSLALVEAGIDFTDQEDVVPIGPRALDESLVDLDLILTELSTRSRSWGELEALPRVVLVGPPSAGKSTLFNALLGRRRAVVDPMPGTTRDVLEEPVTLEVGAGRRLEVLLVDIAGLDEAHALLDREAQAAAERAIERADLALWVVDATRPVPAPPAHVHRRGALRVATKCDVGRRVDAEVRVSGETGEGLDELRAAIVDRLASRHAAASGETLALQPRHEHALRSAAAHLAAARGLLAPQLDAHALGRVELVAGHLRAALDDLAGLGGRLTPDDIIGRVFSTFCVGK